ncbi:hypothetical protein ABEB36_006371 [Hypothenemus hampei]|uniref:RRM domain-containing protein n=1 Tax=Hypothenemus hampei TaxID=57062 RepID=A0ABD1EU91_HYPHA
MSFSSYSSVSSSSSYRDVSKRLQDIIAANPGYQFVQHNGQRIFEISLTFGQIAPPKGSEIFIGNIPKFVFEDELIPLFQKVGPLFKFRLMLDFNNRTRGYGFATYFNVEHAQNAIIVLNGFKLHHVKLAVYKSIDNRRLYVGNIPKEKTLQDVFEVFLMYSEGVSKVIMYSKWECKSENRGFAFVEFETHIAASIARRHFHPSNLVVWEGQALYVDWADPLPDVSPTVLSQVSVLYVKNLPFHYHYKSVHKLFESILGIGMITRTHKIRDYAFVHLKDRRIAEYAKEKLNGLVLEDGMLEVEWARPPQYSTRARANRPPDNFCLSVPLRTRRLLKQMDKCANLECNVCANEK